MSKFKTFIAASLILMSLGLSSCANYGSGCGCKSGTGMSCGKK